MADSGNYATNTSDRVSQLTTALIIIGVVFVSGFLTEGLLYMTLDKGRRFKTLLDYTASSEESGIVVRQDPKYSDAIPIGLSVNERTGIEFSYSFYLFVNPSTFSGDQVLKHVFH